MDETPIRAEFVDGADTLIITVKTMGQAGPLAYAFYNLAQRAMASKLFVRDLSDSWYLGGLDGIGSTVESVRDALRRKINESGASRVRMAGPSMGGFAALLFGALLKVDHVVAFVPQVFVDPGRRAKHGDARWPEQMRRIHVEHFLSRKYWKVDEVIAREHPGMSADIYIGNQDPIDAAHVKYLRAFRNVRIHKPVLAPNIEVLSTLRDQGRLLPAITG